MAALEVRGVRGHDFVVLEGEKYIVGRADDSGIVIEHDTAVSVVHALLERIGKRWFVKDLDSRNGTFVNGERIVGERPLRNDDEVGIGIGKTLLVYSDRSVPAYDPTTPQAPPPPITRREKDVLVELCRPILAGHAFKEPTSVREISKSLYVGEGAIKAHISRLSDKFGILPSAGEKRRVLLANEAIQRGAVTKHDLISPETTDE